MNNVQEFAGCSGSPSEASRAGRLRPNDLGILSFYVENNQNPYLKIWEEEQTVPIGETCFRTLVFGPRDDINNIELPNERNVPMRSEADRLYGAAAYAFMLRLITGLENRRARDSHVTNQFTQGWNKFKVSQPEKAAKMNCLVQNLITDSKLLTTHVVHGIRTQNIQNAAKILSGHKAGQQVIIVGNETNGKISPVTISLARILSAPGKASVSEIGVAHSDAAVRAHIIAEFEDLRHLHKLDPGVMLRDIGPDELADAVENYDRIYCDLPMEREPDFDAKLIEAWTNRFRQDNRFAHLRGSVGRQGTSSPLFETAAQTMQGYISPEQIMAKNAEIGETNRALRARADAMIDYMTARRMAGAHVSEATLREENLIEKISNRPIFLMFVVEAALEKIRRFRDPD